MMARRDGFVQRSARRILENDRYALAAVFVLSLLPYTAWVAMTILALITLRKGWKQSSLLVIPALTAHVLASMMTVVLSAAVIDAFVRVLPCYFAACILRSTSSWKAVAAAFFCLVVFFAFLLQQYAPTVIDAQYAYFQSAIQSIDSGQTLANLWEAKGLQPLVVSNYLIGFQAVCLFFAILSPLMCARSIQSQLYYPGGFRQECLNFRADKYSVLVLILLGLAAYQDRVLAMNTLPLLALYFIMAGLSVGAHVLANMKPWRMFVLLLMPIMVLPLVFLPLYVLIGASDGMFNFRLYLPSRAGKIT